MKTKKQKNALRRQQNLHRRLAHKGFGNACRPMLGPLPIRYELAERTRVLTYGGLGAIHTLVTQLKLPEAINQQAPVFSRHLPYFESDHVLSLAYNLITGGKALEDINRLRRDEVYLDALGAERVPAPSTAGDFLRRFDEAAIVALQEAINSVRVRVWTRQPAAFRQQATLDIDGTLSATEAQCKAGIGYCAYKRAWGYAPLLISLAQTREPLFIVNRPGSAVSHLGAAPWIDRALDLVEEVFEDIWLRGDTDFSLTQHFDKWDRRGVKFIFGYDAMTNLVAQAQALPEGAWRRFERPAAYRVKTRPRRKPQRVRQQIVHERGYKKIALVQEDLAEFAYRPGKCRKAYRMLVLRKREQITRGARLLEERQRYLFYITNDEETPAQALVLFIEGRCDQENTIAQLKSGVPAFHAPSNTLESNWVAMVIGALAWSLKAWYGLLIEEPRLRQAVVRMEFKQFFERFIKVPCQILRQGRRLWYRIVHLRRDTLVFLRLFDRLRCMAFP